MSENQAICNGNNGETSKNNEVNCQNGYVYPTKYENYLKEELKLHSSIIAQHVQSPGSDYEYHYQYISRFDIFTESETNKSNL